MKQMNAFAQGFLRLSLALGFILPVLDRLGYFGPAGTPTVAWGDWSSFIAYTNVLMPYIDKSLAAFFGLTATIAELLFAILLLVGYKIRYVGIGSFLLTLIFATSMMLFLGIRAPFNYSVFVVSFASLLLASQERFPYSLDNYFKSIK
jgi:hypothetical protein